MAPDKKSKDKKEKNAPPPQEVRTFGAKELRKRAGLIGARNVPREGIRMPRKFIMERGCTNLPPEAGLIDKVVECHECGLPVWIEHAEPATETTFQKFKALQRSRQPVSLFEPEEEFSPDDAGEKKSDDEEGEEDEDAEGDDESSLDTVERLEKEVDQLHEKHANLEAEYEKLQDEKDELTEERDDLKEKLKASEDKCEFLQESEYRWRDKFTNLKLQLEDEFRKAEVKSLTISDREGRIAQLKPKIAELDKEIHLMILKQEDVYDRLAHMFPDTDAKELMILQLKAWRQLTVIEQLNRQAQMSQGELHDQIESTKAALAEERERRKIAEETTESHKIMRWQVGRTKLVRLLQVTRLLRVRVLWRGWLQVHPIVAVENQLHSWEERHKLLQESHRFNREQASMVVADILAKVRDRAGEQLRMREIISHQEEDLLASVVRARDKIEQERKAAAELLAQTIEKLQREAQEAMSAAQKAWAEEKAAMIEHIELLESSLPQDKDGRASAKVVAQSKGVICLSCCKQLVHHKIMPLRPEPDKVIDLPGAEEGALAPDTGFFTKEMLSLLQAKRKEEMLNLLQPKKENLGGYPEPVSGPMSRMSRPSSSPSVGARMSGIKLAGRPGTAGGAGTNDTLRKELSSGSLLPGRPPGVGSRALRTEVNAFRQQSFVAWR